MAKKKTDPTTGEPKPKKKRWYHNIADAYRITKEARPALPWILLGTGLGTIAVFLALGFWWGRPIYTGILSIFVALVAVMIVLSTMTRKAAYERIEGQAGAVGAALGQLGRGWYVEDEPVALNPRTQELVFRVVGRPGVVLISEGPPTRVKRLLDDERKKVARVAPGVAIHLIQCGREEGQVPLPKLNKVIKKGTKGTSRLRSVEISAVTKRLAALGSLRSSMPKGIDPMKARPDRKAMRGK